MLLGLAFCLLLVLAACSEPPPTPSPTPGEGPTGPVKFDPPSPEEFQEAVQEWVDGLSAPNLCDEIDQLRSQRIYLIVVPEFFESITEEQLATVSDGAANVLRVTGRAWEVSELSPIRTAEKVLVVAGYACAEEGNR
ncbi:MAG: hypothetical protein F4185_00215 [Chloroflexi bacterium]|nr:hypothetical protein [Chloroflexota bacterium]MYF64459.1 hypothetical protein [Chloroflexota bacterium]MYK35179.1 hypothetical protein [Chloroflexota bacterium]